MNAITPYAEGVTYDQYYQWWVQGTSLYRALASLPIEVVRDSGMQARHEMLIRRWADPANTKNGIRPPETLGQVVDPADLGNLLSWIKQAKTLIYYVAYDGEQAEGQGSHQRQYTQAGPATDNPPKVAKTVQQVPGYTQQWHWPWIEGWDDPAKRRKLMRANNPGNGFKKMALFVGIGAAVWAGTKFLKSRKQNPEENQYQEYEE